MIYKRNNLIRTVINVFQKACRLRRKRIIEKRTNDQCPGSMVAKSKNKNRNKKNKKKSLNSFGSFSILDFAVVTKITSPFNIH